MSRRSAGCSRPAFDLEEIRPFVACLRAGNTSGNVCPDSVLVLRRKLAEVDACIKRLTAVRMHLQDQLAEAIVARPRNGSLA